MESEIDEHGHRRAFRRDRADCGCVHIDHGGEWCHCCGLPSHIGFSVPEHVWKAAVPNNEQGLLCLMCFAAKADRAGVDWSEFIMFWPVSNAVSIRASAVSVEVPE